MDRCIKWSGIASVATLISSCVLCLLQNGTLKITDRKKHIFKLAQGEYIAPEKIECVYSLSDPVAQIFVHGDSLQVSNSCETGSYHSEQCSF